MNIDLFMSNGLMDAAGVIGKFYAGNRKGQAFVVRTVSALRRSAKRRERHEAQGIHIPPYLIASIKIRESTRVSCTACGYCMPCPKGVNSFASLNDTVLKGRLISMFWYIAMAKDQGASQCVRCGKCEKHCPQAIPIRAKLQQTQKELEGFPYKPLRFMVRRVMRRG